MNYNKLSLIMVIVSLMIGGGFVVAANLPTQSNNDSSSSSEQTQSEHEQDDTSSDSESSSDTQNSSSEPESSSSDSSSQSGSQDNQLPRDENGKELVYDVMPMVEAYKTGDTSSLDDKDKQALEAAAVVIDEIITEDMNDYEKALAIHDYIILNNRYNDNILNIFGQSSLDDSTPYGMLVKHTTVCKGYSTTFKLLCNMCGVECELIVEYWGRDIHHAYNRVKIEDSWYYVDVTWDDSEETGTDPGKIDYKYFNLTKAQFALDHTLDKTCPETASDEYTYAAQNLVYVKNDEEYCEAVGKAARHETNFPVYIKLDDSMGVKLRFNDTKAIEEYFEQDENLFKLVELEDRAADGIYIDYAKLEVNGEIVLRVTSY